MLESISSYLSELRSAIDSLPETEISEIGDALYNAYSNNKQVFVIGNGGSASTASHIAADLNKNTIHPNQRRFKIHSLSDNAATVTSLANDISYDEIFSEQLMNLIGPGDVLLVVSGSGNSANVVRAAEYARTRSAQVVSLLGFDGGKMLEISDVAAVIRSDNYGVIEDLHLVINHIFVEYFRDRFKAQSRCLV